MQLSSKLRKVPSTTVQNYIAAAVIGFVLIVVLIILTLESGCNKMTYALLSVFLIPTLSIPFVYLVGKKSAKAAAIFVSLNCVS